MRRVAIVRKTFIMIGLGAAVWCGVTLFSLIFGNWVLTEPGDSHFGPSLFLLILVMLLVIIGLALVVRLRLFPERGSATRFGYAAAAVGLLLDSFILWRREAVFPSFTEGQHHTFSILITLGYALMLLIPAAVDRFVKERADEPDRESDDSKLTPQSAHGTDAALQPDAHTQADEHPPEKELP